MKEFIKKHLNYYTIVTAIGIIACIVWINLIATEPFSDFLYYHQHAIQIANGGSWGDTYTSMGYPILLALVYKIFGANLYYGKILNIILTLITYIFFYLLIQKFSLRSTEKKLLYTIFVFCPINIVYNSLLCSEIVFTCILIGTLVIYFSNLKNKYIYIGILTGVETMIKPFFIVFFFAVFIYELICIDYKKAIIHSLLILFVSVICISPWIYRNTKLVGEFTYVSNNGGIVLYINNNSQNKYGRWMPAKDVKGAITETDIYKRANMTEKNHMLSASAKKWIKSHPIDFIHLGYLRLKNTYYLADDILYTTVGAGLSKNIESSLYIFNSIIKRILLIPALAFIAFYSVYIIYCILKGRRKELNKFITLSMIVFYMFACIYFVTEGQARYSFPVMFLIITYFFYALRIVITKVKGESKCYI